MRLVAFKAWVLRIHCLNLLLRCGEGGLLQLQKLPSLRQVDLKRWEEPLPARLCCHSSQFLQSINLHSARFCHVAANMQQVPKAGHRIFTSLSATGVWCSFLPQHVNEVLALHRFHCSDAVSGLKTQVNGRASA